MKDCDFVFNFAAVHRPKEIDDFDKTNHLFFDELLSYAEQVKDRKLGKAASDTLKWREKNVQERVSYALIQGNEQFIVEDIEELRQQSESPVQY